MKKVLVIDHQSKKGESSYFIPDLVDLIKKEGFEAEIHDYLELGGVNPSNYPMVIAASGSYKIRGEEAQKKLKAENEIIDTCIENKVKVVMLTSAAQSRVVKEYGNDAIKEKPEDEIRDIKVRDKSGYPPSTEYFIPYTIEDFIKFHSSGDGTLLGIDQSEPRFENTSLRDIFQIDPIFEGFKIIWEFSGGNRLYDSQGYPLTARQVHKYDIVNVEELNKKYNKDIYASFLVDENENTIIGKHLHAPAYLMNMHPEANPALHPKGGYMWENRLNSERLLINILRMS